MKRINKKKGMFMIMLILSSIVFTFNSAQAQWECLYEPSDEDVITDNGVGCDDWYNYAPYPDINLIPIKTIRVDFHIIQDENGNGNLSNIPEHIAYLNEIIYWVNWKYSGLSQLNLGVSSPYISDSRIRFSLDEIYFQPDAELWDFTTNYSSKAQEYYNTYIIGNPNLNDIQKNHTLHLIVGGGNYPNLGGAVPGLGTKKYMMLRGFDYAYYYHPQAPFPEGCAGVIDHEFGHNGGLKHNFHGGGHGYQCDDCDDNDPSGLPCPIEGTSNNLMDYWPGGGGGLSQCQLGKMHYYLSGNAGTIGEDVIIKCDENEITTIPENSNVIWYFDDFLPGTLIIEPGAILTVKCVLTFPEDAKIVVKQNGKLVIDGGIVKNECDNLWRGIEVWGHINQPQNPLYQGWVEIINGGTIENALFGIRTIHAEDDETGEGEILDPTTSGGIVFANTARFVNNKTAVRFYSYPQTSMSNFTECEFETNANLISGVTPDYFMWIDHISGVDITDCSFNNTTGIDYLHSGLYAVDATFYIKGRCLAGDPCTEWENGWFRKLDYAVRVINTNTQHYPDIRHTVFSLCKKGVYISNADGARVTSCRFYMPDVAGYVINDYYGLYLNNAFNYHIEDNDFIGPAPGAGGIGMYINNSGTHWNQIYNNTCSGLNYGTIAYGLNRNSFTSVGLCIECNDYDNNKYDIVVNGLMGGSGHGIAHDQGQLGANDTLPAGNTFTQNYSGLVYNYKNSKSMAFINYVYHGHNFTSEKVNPFPYYSSQTMSRQANTQTTYDKDLACPSKLESGGGGGEERIEMEYAMEQMEMKKDQLEELVDGGDTYFMNLGVVTSTPPEAAGVYNELMGESPYLSDTVMKSAIYKENVLPNAMVRDVLVANPQSAKSSEIMDAVDERFEPMPEWMKEQVLEGVSITGAKETLESVIRFWDRKRSDHFENLYQHFRKDTINIQASMDSLELLLAQDNRIESKYRLAFVKMQQGSWSECQAVLNSIPAEFELTPQEESVHQDYFSMFMVLSQLNGNLPVEGSAEAVDLEWLAARDEFYPGACARDILLAARLIEYHEPVILPEEELKSSEVIKNNTLNKSNKPEVLKVFPNPAGDYFIVEYDAEGYSGDISIKANDMTGKQLFINNYSLKRDQVVLNVEDWKSGVYHINLLVNGKLIKSEKISIK
jgi:hypothetical protein